MAQFLHKKKNSNVWYFRRRFPQDLVEAAGKKIHLQSLETTSKRDAEQRARVVSVEFDNLCESMRSMLRTSATSTSNGTQAQNREQLAKPIEKIFQQIPDLVRLAATRVVEEQQKNPREWLETVSRWQSFYRDMLVGRVFHEAQRPAIEAQAILNGIEMAIQGIPPPAATAIAHNDSDLIRRKSLCSASDWDSLCDEAIELYKQQVTRQRCRTAQLKLKEISPKTLSITDIQAALRDWSVRRLECVQASTVKIQLDAMVSALKQALPEITSPKIPQLKGALQPKGSDRESIPLKTLKNTLIALRAAPKIDNKVTAASFDEIAIETLAVLGLRPSELLGATTNALITKNEVFGGTGTYFRIATGKNISSQRDIPVSDGTRTAVNLERLKQMLLWQEQNIRARESAVSSLNRRFRKVSNGHTLYQMRHTWKDIAVHTNIDFELREITLGHKISGIAAVYGSGIPLGKGLDALLNVRKLIDEA